MDALLSPRRRRLLTLAGATLLGSACSRSRRDESGLIQLAGESMGSTWNVRIAGGLSSAATSAELGRHARAAVAAAFDDVVCRMSTFDASSELRRFGAHTAPTPFALSPGTMAVLRRAQQVAAASDGAFDATVAPLVRAWGFGAEAAARGDAPTPATLAMLARRVGWRQLVLDEGSGSARKLNPGLQLDLSGIAKGHAVDRAAGALDQLGFDRYMVEAGGEVRTRGLNAEGRPWQIAVEQPDAWPQQARRIVPLRNHSMATSGDYRNFYELDGHRVSHEIDPATRAPVAHTLASVTVVHEECMSADAWATALFVLGPERGLELARARDLAALFIVRGRGALRDIATPAFSGLA